MVVVPMMMMPRPEVEVKPWAVVVRAMPVPWAVPMTAVPVAPVPDLLNVHTLAGYWLEVSRCAGRRRGLGRSRQEPEPNDGQSRDERTCTSHLSSPSVVWRRKALRRQMLPP